jgi:hypothetical protein
LTPDFGYASAASTAFHFPYTIRFEGAQSTLPDPSEYSLEFTEPQIPSLTLQISALNEQTFFTGSSGVHCRSVVDCRLNSPGIMQTVRCSPSDLSHKRGVWRSSSGCKFQLISLSTAPRIADRRLDDVLGN